jgi:hypothetical protein
MTKKPKKPKIAGPKSGKIKSVSPKPAAQNYNPALQAVILEVVDNQIENLNPPQTSQTFERLVAQGFSRDEARKLIGQAVVSEIFDVLKNQEPYDEARYLAALNRLPGKAWE